MHFKVKIIVIFSLLIHFSVERAKTDDILKFGIFQTEQKDNKLVYDNDMGTQSDAFFELGSDYFKNGQFGEAYEQFQLYIDATKDMNDKDQLIYALVRVGSIYKDKLIFDIALDFYLIALDISKDSEITGDVYTAIGGIYYDQEDFEKSQEFYQKSLETNLKNGERQKLASSYNNLGEIYRFQEDYEKALEFYSQAVVINKQFNNDYFLAINYNNIGEVYLNKKKYNKAFENINASRKLFETVGNIELLAASYTSIGHYYFKTGAYNKAIKRYLKTLDYNLDRFPKKDIIVKDAYYGLYNTYKQLGNNYKELEYYKKYTDLKDSVFNLEKHKAIFEVQTRYETRQKEKEIIYLQEKAKSDQAEKKKQRTNLIIVISLLALVVLLLVYSYILKSGALKQKTLLFKQTNKLNTLEIENKEIENKRLLVENKEFEAREEINRLNREKLGVELEHKERELSTTALHVIGKNEILSNLKGSMEKLIEGSKNDPNIVLKGLIREIDYNINLDKDWDTFKLHFEKVHQGFFTRLKDLYTDLSVDELKFCAYLRINLTSKEIAQILNITPIAINKRRNRLRKKINLNPNDDLFDFMNKV